jgi:hypothetical protein
LVTYLLPAACQWVGWAEGAVPSAKPNIILYVRVRMHKQRALLSSQVTIPFLALYKRNTYSIVLSLETLILERQK